jgi:hypothetical protein
MARPHTQEDRQRRTEGALIPVTEIELYLLLGWRLLDEPCCSYVRMLAPPPDYLAGRDR